MFEIYKDKITADFEEYISLIPRRKTEYINAAQSVKGDLSLLFMKAVTQLVITDAVSVPASDLLRHVSAIYKAITTIDYCKNIPHDIFFDFVLPYRVNDEDFAPCADIFYDELYPMVADKSLRVAAKEVNYWCLSKATYQSSDDRTKNALATVNVGHGRCGEESVLCVSALRAVGIPARQVYSPYWLHCDDNHAWVEVFTGDSWEFMGACEPESELNVGWFNHAASKAGLIRYRTFGKSGSGMTSDENRIFTTSESTDMYAPTKRVRVKIDGFPRTKVGVYTINYGQMSLLREKITDMRGEAVFETGLADLIYFVYTDEGMDARVVKADETEVELMPNEGLRYLEFDLEVPQGIILESFEASEEHKRTVALLDDKRRVAHKAKMDESEYLRKAGHNAPEIEKFLHYGKLSHEQIEMVLDTLSDKDFSDVTFRTLLDIAYAFEYKPNIPDKIFRENLLKMRVKNEPLSPHRQLVRAFWPDEMRPKTPGDVCAYLLGTTKKLDSLSYPGVTGSLTAVLETGITVSENIPVHIVQMLRALGFAARLNPQDDAIEYFDGFGFVPIFSDDEKRARILVKNKSGKRAVYGEDVTISRIDEEGRLHTVKLNDSFDEGSVWLVREGVYACVQSKRQIDGAVSGVVTFINAQRGEGETLVLTKLRDKTEEKLKNVAVDKIFDGKNKAILAYIEPGTEPTEHFLNEIMENAESLKGIEVKLFAKAEKPDKTLKKALDTGLCSIEYTDFDENWVSLRRNMGVGDERLPFATAVKNGKAKFAFANYNVGSVALICSILKI